MIIPTLPRPEVHLLHDVLVTRFPEEAGRLRIAAYAPNLSRAARQRRIVELALADDPARYRFLLRLARAQRVEPHRLSPLEQIKARTGHLNPFGELTGGNFGAGR